MPLAKYSAVRLSRKDRGGDYADSRVSGPVRYTRNPSAVHSFDHAQTRTVYRVRLISISASSTRCPGPVRNVRVQERKTIKETVINAMGGVKGCASDFREIGDAIRAFRSEKCPACGVVKDPPTETLCRGCLAELPPEPLGSISEYRTYIDAFHASMRFLEAKR